MRNFTKRQKRTLRTFAVSMSCCMILAVIMVTVTVANTQNSVPVRFSDILDGATATEEPSENEPAAETMQHERLYETLYPTELLIISTSASAESESHGAGGVLLLETTPTPSTAQTSTTEPTKTTTTPAETTFLTTAETVTQAAPTTTTSATTPRATTAKTTEVTTTAKPSSSTSKTPFTNIGGGNVSNDDSVYIEMLNLVNEARVENGLNELWYSARVHDVSTLRAYELSSYYSHTRPDGSGFYTAFKELGLSYRKVGENIAYGRNMFETAEEVFKAWMDSPSHRDNILNPKYECVAFGLCTLKVGKDTYYYWSQEFALFS